MPLDNMVLMVNDEEDGLNIEDGKENDPNNAQI